MGLSQDQADEIYNLLLQTIRHKLSYYKPETSKMPLHFRLLGRDRMALFSFIQSINTVIGTSIFEQTAVIIARSHFRQAICQYKDCNNTISVQAQSVIQEIMDELTVESRKPDKKDEVRRILEVSQSGEFHQIKCPRIDLFLESWEGVEYYIDLKTVKPNIKNFESFKRMLLEWVAIQGAKEADIKIFTMLALPYNPYEPKPYKRLTMETLFDYPNELLVGEEFWDFLGGENTYPQLLSVFEKAGITLREEIDTRFSQFKH